MLFSRTLSLLAGLCYVLPLIHVALVSAFIHTHPRIAFHSQCRTLPVVSQASLRKTSLPLAAPENSHENNDSSPSTTTSSRTQSGARMAYLVVVHNRRTIQDAIHLFRAIRAEGNIIMIHVDVHSADWSSWSMNDPTHWGMELATTRFRGEWDIFINLSGDCMPVYNPQVMSELFDPSSGPLRETNFVTSSCCETGLVPTSVMDFPKDWHKRTHYGEPIIEYVDDDGQDQQTTLIVHWGSQWMALQPDFVDYVPCSIICGHKHKV